jgi:putative FmdB family regulatory protein
MPTYEYRCSNGHEFEQFQKMSDDPTESCPQCGADAERLLSSGAGLLFKGSGFYITDYRSTDYRSKATSDKESVSDSGTGAKKDGGSDSKSGPSSKGTAGTSDAGS